MEIPAPLQEKKPLGSLDWIVGLEKVNLLGRLRNNVLELKGREITA